MSPDEIDLLENDQRNKEVKKLQKISDDILRSNLYPSELTTGHAIFMWKLDKWHDYFRWDAEVTPTPVWCPELFERLYRDHPEFKDFLRKEWKKECLYIKHDLLCQMYEKHRLN